MNTINKYEQFLIDKTNYWRKAKQLEFSNFEKILQYLTDDFNKLTTRNAITLRILGFVINHGADNLELSGAGQTFINSLYKQKILDEQLMKVYLNGKINLRLTINIIPLKVFLLLFKKIKYFSFEEYKMFICWIHEYEEIDSVVAFITDMRNNQLQYKNIFNLKVQKIDIQDFSDDVSRLFDMLKLSSYFKTFGDKITATLKNEDIDIIVSTFDDQHFTRKNYMEYLTTNDGWEPYNNDIRIVKIIRDIKKNPIEDIKPSEITLDIVHPPKKSESKKIYKSPQKIDFLKKKERDMLAGDRAEKIVVKYEQEQLSNSKLVERVEQVSLIDDTLGYDILSFTKKGKEKHIEVKGVYSVPGSKFNFYISDSEIRAAKEDELYHLYIVFEYSSKSPKIFKLNNIFKEDDPAIKLTAKKYLVQVHVQNEKQLKK